MAEVKASATRVERDYEDGAGEAAGERGGSAIDMREESDPTNE